MNKVKYTILGLGLLLPWNVCLSAIDFYIRQYPDHNVAGWFSWMGATSILVSITILLFINSYLQRCFSTKGRMTFAFVLMLLGTITIPILAVYLNNSTGWIITLVTIVFINFGDGLGEGVVGGQAGQFDKVEFVSIGQALSGTLISLGRIITKASFSQDEQGMIISTWIYYGACCLILLMCIAFALTVKKIYHPLVEIDINGEVHGSEFDHHIEGSTKLKLIKNYIHYEINIVLLFVMSLIVFPNLLVASPDVFHLGNGWLPIILIGVYNVGDLMGRMLAKFVKVEKLMEKGGMFLYLFSILRFGLLLFYFFTSGVPVLIVTLVVGLTNGYLATLILTHVLTDFELGNKEKEFMSFATYFCLLLGIVIGLTIAMFVI